MGKKFYGYKAAVATIVMLFTALSIFSLYSCMMPDIMARLQIGASTMGIGITISSIMGFAFSFVAGKVYTKIEANIWLRAQPVVTIVLLLSYLYAPSIYIIWILHIAYGFIWGFGFTNGAAVYISQWFIERRDEMVGYANSAVTLGGALSSFLFGIFSRSIGAINIALILILGLGAISLVSATMLVSPNKLGQKPLGYGRQVKEEGVEAEVSGIDVKAAVKSPSLALLCIGCFIVGLVAITFGYLTVMASNHGFSLADAAMVFTCYTLLMGIGCSMLGKACEKAGVKVYLAITYGCAVLGIGLIYLWLRSSGSHAFLFIAVAIAAVGLGGMNMISPMVAPAVFGMKSFSSLMPIIAGFFAAGSGIGVFFIPAIATADKGDWTRAMFYCLISALISGVIIALAYILRPMKAKNLQDGSSEKGEAYEN